VGHAIRRIIKQKRRIKSRELARGLKAEASSVDDDNASRHPNRGNGLPSLDDFIQSDADVSDGPASNQGPTMKGIEPAPHNVSASMIMPHKLDGVVVPSFLSQEMVACASGSPTKSFNEHGEPQIKYSSFSMDQPMVRPKIAYLQSSQQQQSDNNASLLNMLSHSNSLRRQTAWKPKPVQSIQHLGDNTMQQQQDQGLPRTSVSVPTNAAVFDQIGNLHQARIAAVMDEQHQMFLQRRLSLTGELGVAAFNTSSNNPAIVWLGFPSLSANSSGNEGYGMTGAPSFSALAPDSMGSMVLPSTYTMDSSLTAIQGLASLNDLSFVQSQQMQRLQMTQLFCSNNNTKQGMDRNNITNSNFNNDLNQRQFY
jgi:hypothetical protein